MNEPSKSTTSSPLPTPDDAELEPRRSLTSDLRRVVPVWIVLLAASLAVLWWFRVNGGRMLTNLAYTTPQPYALAMVYKKDGADGWARYQEKVNTLRVNDGATTTTGVFRGEPGVAKARADLLKSRQLYPNSHDIPKMLADLALWDGHPEEAYLWHGQYALDTGRSETALMNFETAARLGAKGPQLLEGRLAALLALGRVQDARRLAEAPRPDAEKTSVFFLLYADVFARLGDQTRREQLLREAVRRDPNNPRAIKALGSLLRDLGRKDEAYRLWEEALGRITNDANLWHLQSGVARQLNRPRDAARCYEKALAIDPNNFVLHNEVAQLYMEMGDARRAQPHLRRALELNPSYFREKSAPK